MKIAFICPFIYRLQRGIENFTINLSNELVKQFPDIEISILTWRGKKNQQFKPYGKRLQILNVPYSRYFQSKAAIPFYLAYLLIQKHDLVNVFFADYGEGVTLKALRWLKKQKFNIIFGYPYSQTPQRYQGFQKLSLLDEADKIITKTSVVSDEIGRVFGKESIVIGNGFSSGLFSPNRELRLKMGRDLGFSLSTAAILVRMLTNLKLHHLRARRLADLRTVMRLRACFPDLAESESDEFARFMANTN